MPGDFGGPVVTTVCIFFCTRAAGASGIRHSPRPLFSQGAKIQAKPGRIAPRDREIASDERERATLSARLRPRRRATRYSRDIDDRTEKPRRAGYPACAGYDGSLRHCEKRKRGSHSFFLFWWRDGLLRETCHRAALRVDPVARNDDF
jgi:hypothetical protein